MRSDSTADLFARVPRWWFEPIVGSAVVTAASSGLAVGSLGVRAVLDSAVGLYPAAGAFSQLILSA